MQTAGKILDGGTLVIKRLTGTGKLLNKRVVNSGVQYDSYFRRNKCVSTIITDSSDNSQMLILMPKKLSLFSKLRTKLFGQKSSDVIITNSKGEKYKVYPPINMKLMLEQGMKNLVRAEQIICGFKNSEIDNIEASLRKSFILKNFR